MIDPELLENAARIGLSVEGLSERDLRLRLQKLAPAGAAAALAKSVAAPAHRQFADVMVPELAHLPMRVVGRTVDTSPRTKTTSAAP